MPTPAPRGLAPTPPDKGSFPLDHYGECREVKQAYMTCLRGSRGAMDPCRDIAKEYLQCRMDRGLMAPEELTIFRRASEASSTNASNVATSPAPSTLSESKSSASV